MSSALTAKLLPGMPFIENKEQKHDHASWIISKSYNQKPLYAAKVTQGEKV